MHNVSKQNDNDTIRTFELVSVEQAESAKVEGGAAVPLTPYIPGPCFPRPTVEYAKM